jgi:ERCC4-type nuclease
MGSQQAFTLPALRSLGTLAGAEPTIVIDSREQTPLPFSKLKTQAGTLLTGDYSVAGLENLFAVERKSISDLVGCCIGQNREREIEMNGGRRSESTPLSTPRNAD